MVNKDSEPGSRTPDGGWGWMVAMGCAIMVFLMPLLTLCFSILFSEFLLEQEVSSTTTAWIFNTHTFCWNIVGPFIGPLTKEMGFRPLSMTTAVMASISVLACAFTMNTAYLLTFFSLAGLFGGLTIKPCYLIIPMYFDKRRGMANAILMAGMCSGQFAGPPVVRYLLKEYGFTGATIIISAILLNCSIGASFFHPLKWHLKPPLPSTSEMIVPPPVLKEALDNLKKREETESLMNGKDHTKDNNCSTLTSPAVLKARRNERRFSDSSNVSSVAISMVDLSAISHQREGKKQNTQGKETHLVVRVIRSLISDLRILRYHRAQIIAFGGLFLINGYLNFLMVFPFAIQAAGYTLQDAAWSVSITGVCNFVARLFASVLSDYSWFHMQVMYVVGAVIIAASSAIFSFQTSLVWMKITLSLWSFGIGINISLYPLVMARVMGVENMPAIFGTQSLIVGLGYVALGPLIGYVRDVSGSYAISIWVMSAEVWLTVILWCFMPTAIKKDQRRDDSHDDTSADNVS